VRGKNFPNKTPLLSPFVLFKITNSLRVFGLFYKKGYKMKASSLTVKNLPIAPMSKARAYALLDLKPSTATPKKIREAYRHKALLYHPDKFSGAESENPWNQIQTAYEFLTNPDQETSEDPKAIEDISALFMLSLIWITGFQYYSIYLDRHRTFEDFFVTGFFVTGIALTMSSQPESNDGNSQFPASNPYYDLNLSPYSISESKNVFAAHSSNDLAYRKLNLTKEPPEELTCPITGELVTRPMRLTFNIVVAAIEEAALFYCFQLGQPHPISKESFTLNDLKLDEELAKKAKDFLIQKSLEAKQQETKLVLVERSSTTSVLGILASALLSPFSIPAVVNTFHVHPTDQKESSSLMFSFIQTALSSLTSWVSPSNSSLPAPRDDHQSIQAAIQMQQQSRGHASHFTTSPNQSPRPGGK
jgi:DnaJ-like protein